MYFTNEGYVFPLESKWDKLYTKTAPEDEGAIFVGHPETLVEKLIFNNSRANNLDSLTFSVTSPWLEAKREISCSGDCIFVTTTVQKKKWLRGIIKPKNWTVGAGLLLLTASGTYLGLFHNRAGSASNSINQCMVWQEDHYELTDCNHPVPGKLVVAADPERIKNFRKIGDAYVDTITARSIGQLWYLKKDNKLEYFTCRGTHPIFTDKALKPLSLYMYSKYIHPEGSSNPQLSSSRMR